MIKKKILTALSAAFVSSLFLSMTGLAADETFMGPFDITAKPYELTVGECGNNCQGHWFTGKTANDQPNSITVLSGKHRLKFQDLEIDASNAGGICPLHIAPGASVELTLGNSNILKGAKGYAGIYVPGSEDGSASLTIKGTGTLDVYGGDDAAAIGGQSRGTSSSGIIDIQGGIINAEGGSYSAGIGGNQKGSAGTITINGEKVKLTATGGNGTASGAPGIGCGSEVTTKAEIEKSGKVIIKEGDVTAYGGSTKTGTGSAGIRCATLSSGYGKQLVLKSSIDSKVNKAEFNGIAWTDWKKDTQKGTTCYVYGDAVLDKSFTLESNQVMILQEGNSLTIPDGWETMKGQLLSAPAEKPEDVKNTKGGTIINIDQCAQETKDRFYGKFSQEVILTKDDIEVTAGGTPYTGGALFDALVHVKPKRVDANGTEYGVDYSPDRWTHTIDRVNAEGTVVEADLPEIVNAGVYRVTFNHDKHGKIVLDDKPVVNTVDIASSTIGFKFSGDYVYNGDEQTPQPILTYNTRELKLDKDYENMHYSENTDAGTATVTVDGKQPGNFYGTKTMTFSIAPAKIEQGAVVTLDNDSFEYNGEEQKPTVTVTYGTGDAAKTLTPDKDYTVEYLQADKKNPSNCKDAGKVVVLVTGKGNYQGKSEATYEITKRRLNIHSISQATDRAYVEGNNKVTIEGKFVTLNLDNAVEKEIDQILPPESFEAEVEKPDVGSYSEVTYGDLQCTGAFGFNYVITGDTNKLTNLVNITKAARTEKAPVVTVPYDVSPINDKQFQCTIKTDKPAPAGAIYEYQVCEIGREPEDGKWVLKNIYDFEPLKEARFFARIRETENTLPGEAGSLDVIFKKLDREKPKDFTMKYYVNEDSTFTVEIPEVEGVDAEDAEYAIIEGNNAGGTFDHEIREKTDCQPNKTYTGAIRFKENATHNQSEVTKSTLTLPAAPVSPPTFTPEDGTKFYSKQEITLECATEGATIFYVIGSGVPEGDATSGPSGNTKIYNPDKKPVIEDSTIVKAMAVKVGMANSSVVQAKYTKTGDIITDVQKDDVVDDDGFVYTDDLKEIGYTGEKDAEMSIIQTLTQMITGLNEGFTYENMAFYEIRLQIAVKTPNGEPQWMPATIENFPEKGLKVTMPYPNGTGKKTHEFKVCHMFAETSARLKVNAGETEMPKVTKTDDGLEFTLKSTSPLAIAWKETKNGNTNTGDDNNGNGTTDDNNGGNNTDNNGNGADNTDVIGTNPDDNNGDGTGIDGQSGDGTGATGTDAANGSDPKAAGNTADGKDASGIQKFLPTTGDPVTIAVWVVLLIAAVGAIVVIIKKRR